MKLHYLFGLILAFGVTGCSINHPVAKDYGDYLAENATATSLPKANLDSDYTITKPTQNHRYEFRAATVGYAHLWIVEFGKILDDTLKAKYVQDAFGDFKQTDLVSAPGNLVSFNLVSYEFKDYRAYVTLEVSLTENGVKKVGKAYSAEGVSKGGQMWGAGPFGMKSATLESTKSAIDSILQQFITDLNAK